MLTVQYTDGERLDPESEKTTVHTTNRIPTSVPTLDALSWDLGERVTLHSHRFRHIDCPDSITRMG